LEVANAQDQAQVGYKYQRQESKAKTKPLKPNTNPSTWFCAYVQARAKCMSNTNITAVNETLTCTDSYATSFKLLDRQKGGMSTEDSTSIDWVHLTPHNCNVPVTWKTSRDKLRQVTSASFFSTNRHQVNLARARESGLMIWAYS